MHLLSTWYSSHPEPLIFEKVTQVLGQFPQCINKAHYSRITVIWERKIPAETPKSLWHSLKTLQSMLHFRLPLNKPPGSLHPFLKTLLRKKENAIVVVSSRISQVHLPWDTLFGWGFFSPSVLPKQMSNLKLRQFSNCKLLLSRWCEHTASKHNIHAVWISISLVRPG